jgi:predicted DNA-binding transcriptional regulator AlpA
MKSHDDRGCPAAGTDEVFLSSMQLRHRYGITDMALWRWLNDPTVAYPKPMTVGGRRYWKLSAVQEFEIQQTQKRAPKNPNLGRPRKIKAEAMEE